MGNEKKKETATAKQSHAYMRMRVRDLCSVLRPWNIDQKMMSVKVMKMWVKIFTNMNEMYNEWCKEHGINQTTGIEYAVVRDYADTIEHAKGMSMTAKEKAELERQMELNEIAMMEKRIAELKKKNKL